MSHEENLCEFHFNMILVILHIIYIFLISNKCVEPASFYRKMFKSKKKGNQSIEIVRNKILNYNTFLKSSKI